MKTLLVSVGAIFAATSAFAGGICEGPLASTIAECATPVPEISALQGTAALAAVAAIMLLMWERRRRHS